MNLQKKKYKILETENEQHDRKDSRIYISSICTKVVILPRNFLHIKETAAKYKKTFIHGIKTTEL